MIYDLSVTNNAGEITPLNKYKGKVLLIVNTATHCGFTYQYQGLQKLYEEIGSDFFAILDFPCSQFKDQTPENEAEIKSFCTGRFGVTFDLYSKVLVNGPQADPLFKLLKEAKSGLFGKNIKWNFTKFLVDHEGKVIKRYAPNTEPATIKKDIIKLINKAASK